MSWEARLFELCRAPTQGRRLVWLALAMSSPALWLPLYMDDVFLRFIYSDLPGAADLYRMYGGVFGISDGRASTLWQMEHGYAPWWSHPDLHVRLFRPLSVASHWIDAKTWLGNSALMHAHSLVWLALLVLAVTWMMRVVHPGLLGGMAALLFAIDHTHGFVVGYVANRHALIAGVFGALCFGLHVRSVQQGSGLLRALSVAVYALGLLASEATVAVCGYVFAHALLASTGTWRMRVLQVAPIGLVTCGWRAFYVLAGYGSRGSGVYVDPAADPLRFVELLATRAPALLQAAFSPLPADVFTVTSASWASALQWSAWIVIAIVMAALVPLLRRDRDARAWALGMLVSVIPASATFASNRQLLFTSFGAVALVAQLWHLYAVQWRAHVLLGWSHVEHRLAVALLFTRLFVSPWMLPFSTCAILFTGALQHSGDSIGDEIAGRDVVLVTAPDEMTLRLTHLQRRLEGRPLPRRWRVLSLGDHAIEVTRVDDTTLDVTYAGGLFTDPFTELFRDRKLPMHVGQRVPLEGLQIQVLDVTDDARPRRVRFAFDADLDAPSFAFYAYLGGQMQRWRPPPTGGRVALPPARTRWWLW